MRSQDRFPDELWLEVFHNLPGYYAEVSLTCRTFHRISRPFLFADFYFFPYADVKGALRLPQPAEVERRLECLKFWSSAEIAPLVRQCHISPWTSSWLRIGFPAWDCCVVDPYILLDALFDRLPCFSGMQRLHAQHIHFTQASVDIVCRLPNLSELTVYACSVAPGESMCPSPPTLRVSKLSVHYEVDSGQGDDFQYENDQWISLVHPDHLRELSTRFDPRLFGRAIHSLRDFPRVHTLRATMDFPTPSQNLLILSKFPAVRILSISGTGPLTDGTTSQPCADASLHFPLLEKYTGSSQSLPLFIHISTLTHLTAPSCSPRDFLTQIRGVQGPMNITSLLVKFNKSDNEAFKTLVGSFPQLTELKIHIVLGSDDDMFTSQTFDADELEEDMIIDPEDYDDADPIRIGFKPSIFFQALAYAPLPPRLERLILSWESKSNDDWHPPSAYKVPNFEQLRDALIARCPGLAWLWLDGYYFLFKWRISTPDGGVEEDTAFDSDEALGFRCASETDDIWDLW
ncbi:hypothetical protein C8R44DRAFT_988062 [Mycena epipterygia]|nr:hypothetical protein C8R44DRAFT_988062 [Mycena epipterygia]